MTVSTLSFMALGLAAVPCVMFLVNLVAYRRLPPARARNHGSGVSVLIPARDEEDNIEPAIRAVLANRDASFEVIVLDDHSTDRTAQLVQQIAAADSRVRLERAPPLPPGWCGKQHACYQLARLARHPLLLFIDADVRLAPDALGRIAAWMSSRHVDLASGVPRQELGTFGERLLLPLIHFLLLGFLPMHLMRWFRWSAFGAGCGQLFVARAAAYSECGGHSRIPSTLHDGLKLPKVFRRAGFRTDLFDATDLARCRMYRSAGEVWRGLGKNATEGLAAPATIGPMTFLLLGGQVLPWGLLAFSLPQASAAWPLAAAAAVCSLLPRLFAARRFSQPFVSVLLHPLAVTALLIIQWSALWRLLTGQHAQWKGRPYRHASPVPDRPQSILAERTLLP